MNNFLEAEQRPKKDKQINMRGRQSEDNANDGYYLRNQHSLIIEVSSNQEDDDFT